MINKGPAILRGIYKETMTQIFNNLLVNPTAPNTINDLIVFAKGDELFTVNSENYIRQVAAFHHTDYGQYLVIKPPVESPGYTAGLAFRLSDGGPEFVANDDRFAIMGHTTTRYFSIEEMHHVNMWLEPDGYVQIGSNTGGPVNWVFQLSTGNLEMQGPGSTISYKEDGDRPRQGVVTLVAGTVTVNTCGITSNSRIQLTNQNGGSAPGTLYISARDDLGFTITSTSATDDCDVAWVVMDKII